VSPTYEDRIPLGLTAETSDRLITWGQQSVVSGVLTQGEERLDGETVVLESDPYPFDRDYAEAASADTAGGRFSFRVEPDVNTAYRIAAGELSEATSRPVRVYVEPRMEVEEVAENGAVRLRAVFRHPEESSLAGSNLFLYASPAEEAKATGRIGFVGVERVEQKRPGLSEASARVLLPGEIVSRTCVAYTPDSAMGEPSPGCSQSSIPLR
jgi:hypothetical protein